MIVITGAAGALGGATVDHLLTRVSAEDLVVVTRDPARAQRFADLGIAVRRGDYAEPDTLPAAFAGADQLLLVSSNDPTADAVALHRTAIEAAVEVGVGRVLYTSHQGAAGDSPFFPARDHHATEELIAASGLPWTSLRNGFYAHSLPMLAGPWRETGRIAVPADGPVSWTDRAELGEAAAVILHAGSGYDGSITLTAAAAPTFADLAPAASRLAGRPVEVVLVEPERWVADQVAIGQPDRLARFLLGMYQAADQGFFAGTDPLLGELLGRAPRSAEDALAAA